VAKHLSTRDLDLIVRLIDAWEGKLGWEALCDATEPLIGTRPTRQTLNAHERIKSAFAHQKKRLKSGFISIKRPASLSIAEQRIRRLEAENSRLQREINQLLERFIRWQYNAHKFNVSADKLDAPLPFVDRDSSEKI
jgi:dsDNA-specific endonuclease/ATPase MutS2